MNKFILSLCGSALLSSHAIADIIISEVVEGTGYHKAIEIGNVGDSTVTLNGYQLQLNVNFGGNWTGDYSLDGITLAPYETYVVGNGNTNNDSDFLSRLDDINNTIANFNGDDPIRLTYNGNTVDMVGPDPEFNDRENFNKDITLVRRNYTPNTSWDINQWEVRSTNDWSDLGYLDQEGTTPPPVEGIPATIMELQGEGAWSPYTDPSNGIYESEDYFAVTGVVTHIQEQKLGNDLLVGFFMQDQFGDGNPKTSEGIFVNAQPAGLETGDEVTVVGKVYEHYYWTQLNAASVEATGVKDVTITPTTIETIPSDLNFEQTLERYEGMLVRVNDQTDMRVTRTFGFDYSAYRNNMVLSYQTVNYHPNQLNAPLSEGAIEQDELNQDRRLFVESPVKASDGVVPWYENFAQDNGTGTTDDYIRVGASLSSQGLTGVIGYSYNEYRLYVLEPAGAQAFDHSQSLRPTQPDVVTGDLSVASFNVENFFTSPFGGRDNPLNQNRGAETYEEYQIQLDKIVSALVALDADIVGLIEIENNGFDEQSAIDTLVNALNSQLPKKKQYRIAKPKKNDGEGYVGTDAITNKIIYRKKAAKVKAIDVIEMPQQHVLLEDGSYKRAYQRDAFTATFKVKGAKKPLIVSTNHFKSKGSTCWEDEQGTQPNDPDLQGSCERFRVSAAYHLAETLGDMKGYKIVMGDLNSYGLEDPMLVLTDRKSAPKGYETFAARNTYIGGDETTGQPLHGDDGAKIKNSYGYIDIVESLKPHSYSYSYNDTVGTLDYVLVDKQLEKFVIDAQVWPINAVESTLFEYSSKYSGDLPKYGDAYRSSDHDPAIVTFKFGKK
ncbi:ExeM/NucH family extracellular endonuclease [Vibrio astriarenae]